MEDQNIFGDVYKKGAVKQRLEDIYMLRRALGCGMNILPESVRSLSGRIILLSLGRERYEQQVLQMIEEREVFRKNKHFGQADHMRNRIKKEGFEVIDGKKGLQIKKVVS